MTEALHPHERPASFSLEARRASIDAEYGSLPLADGTSASLVEVGGVGCIECTRERGVDDPTLVYFHGGGYLLASALAYRAHGTVLAKVCHARVLLVDYRLAPENPFPAALHDALSVYRGLLDAGQAAERIVIAGDSAGGGLTAALPLATSEADLPLPAGAICLSPWVDLTNTALSHDTATDTDTTLIKAAAEEAALLYLAGHDARDPLASPVFGRWEGMPPLLVLVSDTEVLLDDAARLVAVASAAGVDVEYHVFAGVPHLWQFFQPALPETARAIELIAAFVARVTGTGRAERQPSQAGFTIIADGL